jgi:hypothetical protein
MKDEMQEVADAIKSEMVRDGLIVLLTQEEAKLVRKILQCANQLYTVMEDGYTENKVDRLLRKLRRYEDG